MDNIDVGVYDLNVDRHNYHLGMPNIDDGLDRLQCELHDFNVDHQI